MAVQKLDVSAHGAPGLAEEGTTERVHIVACVTKADGTPFSGLIKSKFKVRKLVGLTVVDPSIKSFSEVSDSALAGYYNLTVAPPSDQYTWTEGDYVFAVTVNTVLRGGNTAKGRALATVHIPSSSEHV
jgi:hypothetical protein